MRDDFRQLAYLTILEEAPKYDPDHSSGASFITFMKSHVCGQLWSERRKESKYTPFSHDEGFEAESHANPLVASLTAEACASESLEDEMCQKMEMEDFRSALPQLLAGLGKKERQAIELKFFKDCSGVEISRQLSVSEGRVSQLLKSALSKLKKAHSRLGGETAEEHPLCVF
jgi:RNA polymerase sigma factor (sigma-70 family)